MPGDAPEGNVPIQAVGRVFEIVEQLRADGPAGVTTIAERLDLPKSTVHGYLTSMKRCGFVMSDDGKYRLGLRFLDLGNHARGYYRLYETAKPEINELVAELGERAQVMVEEDGRGVYIYQTNGENAIQTDSHIGLAVNLHTTAAGKAYLAFQPPKRRDELVDGELETLTEHSIADPDELREELETVRERGYALNMEEKINGMRAVGAPILDDGVSTAAISISGPTTRFNGEFFRDELPERMSRVANVIGVKTTYS